MPNVRARSLQDNLLTNLKNSGFFGAFHLAVYCRNNTAECPADGQLPPCSTSHEGPLCAKTCIASLPNILDQAPPNGAAAVIRCPVGLLGFIKKFRHEKTSQCYVVGCGVRERSLDLYRIENISRTEGIDPFALLEHLQGHPVLTEQDVQEAAERASKIIDSLTSPFSARSIPENERLQMVTALSSYMDKTESARETLIILGEAIGMMFDVPSIAVALPDTGGRNFMTEVIWGHALPVGPIQSEYVPKVFPRDAAATVTLDEDSLKGLFPNSTASTATCQLLSADDKLLGIVAFFDTEFTPEEFLHVELLSGRAALRLARLQQQEDLSRKNTLATRLLSMISSLAVTGGQELHDQILQMGSELVDATTGSLMILDEEKESLQITSAIGMSPQLLKVLKIKLGSGIAGKVALSGHPLLVNDIERDERVAAPNRPRFKTKSFLSLPLLHEGRVSGVLNLSDKRNNEIFTERDLEVLTPFVRHVSLMMQRTTNEKKVELLERLSITDPLTELYNRRYLERRMEEEINRSLRTGQNLTVMLIDLDYFKTYNDVCGHIAGDKALKKAANVLNESVREMDVVTRYGGEEFCVLLPGTSKRESIFVAERIRRDIENEFFPGEEHLPFGRLTTSIGVSSFPEDGSTSISIINAADIALYDAKKAGRNRIVIFSNTDTSAQPAKVTQLKK